MACEVDTLSAGAIDVRVFLPEISTTETVTVNLSCNGETIAEIENLADARDLRPLLGPD